MDLKIVADVELGDGAVFPVYRIKRASVDAKWITDTLIAIWPNIVEKREQERSYEELTEDWLIIKRGQFDDVDENGKIIWMPWEDEEERLSALQEIMDQTPKESTYLPFSADAISTEETQFTLRRQDFKQKNNMRLPGRAKQLNFILLKTELRAFVMRVLMRYKRQSTIMLSYYPFLKYKIGLKICFVLATHGRVMVETMA